jgi:hypothetical protein
MLLVGYSSLCFLLVVKIAEINSIVDIMKVARQAPMRIRDGGGQIRHLLSAS